MKQTTNITILVMVLSIPFALSQTRKAIPAGRYEALSGVKISHSVKGTEGVLTKESQSLFWTEVAKHFPQGPNRNTFFAANDFDSNARVFLTSKGVVEAKQMDSKVNILLSDNMGRDHDLIKKLKGKGGLLILKEKKVMKEILASFPHFEVLVFQAEGENNYYLLRSK